MTAVMARVAGGAQIAGMGLPPRASLIQPLRQLASLEVGADRVLPGPELRARGTRIRRLRRLVQGLSLLLVVEIGVEFVLWLEGVRSGQPIVARPAGAEGFLPIVGLLGFRHLLLTGEVHPVRPAALVVFLAIVAVSLLVKKAFCSWICPIGTLAEGLDRLGRWLIGPVRVPRFVDVPLRGLKYLLLLFFAHAIFVTMSGPSVAAFLDSPYTRVADVRMLMFFTHLTSFRLGVLGLLVVLSIVIPYFWCRYLCPYGALLGLGSLLAPLKVTRHAPSCIDCGLCTKACPSRLPVATLKRVRSDECNACLSCVAACPVPRALRVEAPAPLRLAPRPLAVAALVVAVFLGGIGAGRLAGHWQSSISDAEYRARVRLMDLGSAPPHP